MEDSEGRDWTVPETPRHLNSSSPTEIGDILGESERQIAEKFGEAAKTYIDNPVALHLRDEHAL